MLANQIQQHIKKDHMPQPSDIYSWDAIMVEHENQSV